MKTNLHEPTPALQVGQLKMQKAGFQRRKEGSQTTSLTRAIEGSQRVSQLAALQAKANDYAIQPKPNRTGMPDQLKTGIENLSGFSMDDVRVHYNSAKPAQLQAHAYAQGTDIHLGPGQEKHLPHEAWHVIQQKQGRVQPTMQLKGVAINDNEALEREADVMGGRGLTVQRKEGIESAGLISSGFLTGKAIQKTGDGSPQTTLSLEKDARSETPENEVERVAENISGLLNRLEQERMEISSQENDERLGLLKSYFMARQTRVLKVGEDTLNLARSINEKMNRNAKNDKLSGNQTNRKSLVTGIFSIVSGIVSIISAEKMLKQEEGANVKSSQDEYLSYSNSTSETNKDHNKGGNESIMPVSLIVVGIGQLLFGIYLISEFIYLYIKNINNNKENNNII